MLRIILFLLCIATLVQAQEQLPHVMTPSERFLYLEYLQSRGAQNWKETIINTPPSSPVRTIGEWEELQALLVTWKSYTGMLSQIVKAAKAEVPVIIAYEPPESITSITATLAANGCDTSNVMMLNIPINSVWSRDFGPWSAYTNEVDTLVTIDWIYNRPRPEDDALPSHIAAALNTPFYETTTVPYNLIHTGGNFMTDGFGTGFSSNLIVNENPTLSIAQIDTTMNRFMGIYRYIKMNTLPFDQIHHIDMHMKLLDEETILMGEYPIGIADGPQIEANLQYVLSNFMSVYGTPYKVIRIPMPADNGKYPHNGGRYFTYTNSSFVNKTIIVPTYNIPQDSIALQIYREALPGYQVIGINSLASIGALGALHCITKELGVNDPLLISHKELSDTYDQNNPYFIQALVKHRSGISAAYLYYRTDTVNPYSTIAMTQGFNPDYWLASIPAQVAGTQVYYYVEAIANSGKQQVRPMPAPQGYWSFKVLQSVSIHEILPDQLKAVYPNPSKGLTVIPMELNSEGELIVEITDALGRSIEKVYQGFVPKGAHQFFINSTHWSAGVYVIKMKSKYAEVCQKLLVR